MSQPKNPINDELLLLIHEGKSILKLSPEMHLRPNKKVFFHFEDGSTQELQTEGDHNTFMRWWRETSSLLRRLMRVESLPDAPFAGLEAASPLPTSRASIRVWHDGIPHYESCDAPNSVERSIEQALKMFSGMVEDSSFIGFEFSEPHCVQMMCEEDGIHTQIVYQLGTRATYEECILPRPLAEAVIRELYAGGDFRSVPTRSGITWQFETPLSEVEHFVSANQFQRWLKENPLG